MRIRIPAIGVDAAVQPLIVDQNGGLPPPDTYDGTHRMIAAAKVDGIVGAIEAMMLRPDSTPALATIDVPTLIIVGEEDAITPPKDARDMAAGIRGSRLEVIPAAGHLSNLERPAAFNTALADFVGSLLYN